MSGDGDHGLSATGTGPDDALRPVRVDAPLVRVTVARLCAEVLNTPDGSWSEAIMKVLTAHVGQVIAP